MAIMTDPITPNDHRLDKAHWEPAHRVRRQLWDMGAGESSDRAVGPGYRAGVDRQPTEGLQGASDRAAVACERGDGAEARHIAGGEGARYRPRGEVRCG